MNQQIRKWRREFSVKTPEDWGKVNNIELEERITHTNNVPIAKYGKAGSTKVAEVVYCPDEADEEFAIDLHDGEGVIHGHAESSLERAEAALEAIIYMSNHMDTAVKYERDNWEHQLEDVKRRAKNVEEELEGLSEDADRLVESISKTQGGK